MHVLIKALLQVVMQSLDKWLDLFLAEHNLSSLHGLRDPEASCRAPWTPTQVSCPFPSLDMPAIAASCDCK